MKRSEQRNELDEVLDMIYERNQEVFRTQSVSQSVGDKAHIKKNSVVVVFLKILAFVIMMATCVCLPVILTVATRSAWWLALCPITIAIIVTIIVSPLWIDDDKTK